ncbi:MAG: TonB-dependent receptor [Opitutaceae bacterium]|nr:TonB-dependent receptor [Opitutaceae bacterium]
MFRRNNRGRPATDMRVLGTDPADGSRNKYLGEFARDFMDQYGRINTLGPDMYNDCQLDTLNLTLTHQFAPNVNLRVAYNNSETTQDYDYQALGSSTISVDPITRQFVRWNAVPSPRYRQLPADVENIQADLTVDWETEEVKHSTLLTFDYTNQFFDRISERGARGRASDVHTVDYGTGPVPNLGSDSQALHGPRTDPIPSFDPSINFFDTPEYYTRLTENRTLDYDIVGLFVMHRARFFQDKLLVMAGGRYDEATTEIINRLSPDKVTEVGRTKSKVDDLTYNIGLNYNVTPQTVLYGSHSTSFNPKGDVFSHTGDPMPNELGHGYEFGFRTQALDQRLDLGGSVFSIERQNIRIRNPDFDSDVDSPADKPEFIAGGLDRAEGFELYANGKLTDNWSVRFSGGTVEAKHIKSLDAWREGLRLQRVPDWNYALGTSYRVASGALKGLRLNASYRAQSDYRLQTRNPTANDLRNNLRSGQGGSLDLAVGYGWRSSDRLKHTFRVAMKNALDDVFIEGSGYFSLSRRVTASYTLEY